MALVELLHKSGEADFLRAVAAVPHHLAGLADIAELFGKLQQAHFRPNNLLLLRHVVISVPPVGRARFQLDENRAAPSGFASETNNECQIKSKLLQLIQAWRPIHALAPILSDVTNCF